MDLRMHRRQSDKLEAFREVFVIFTTHCIKNHAPGTHVTTGEQLVSFQGKCPLRVSMKSKPEKHRMKIWTMADVDSQYFLNQLGKLGNTLERNQGRRVVLDLKCCLQKCHDATTDNFLTSLLLAENLLRRYITLCDTMRRSRNEIPQ
jgi:hypothetical protein